MTKICKKTSKMERMLWVRDKSNKNKWTIVNVRIGGVGSENAECECEITQQSARRVTDSVRWRRAKYDYTSEPQKRIKTVDVPIELRAKR